jgi:hypothetical protein
VAAAVAKENEEEDKDSLTVLSVIQYLKVLLLTLH